MRRIAVAAIAVATDAAFAQAADSTPVAPLTGTPARQVWQHLDPLGIAVVSVCVLILILLVARIAQIVKRERGPRGKRRKSPTRRPKAGKAVASRKPSTGAPASDWGSEQNKRSSGTRARMDGGAADATPSSLDLAPAQWSRSEVLNAAQASLAPGDSMGKSTSRTPSPYRTGHNPFFTGESVEESVSMEVEEVADVMLQAELLVQLGDPKQAMTLLSQHIRDTKEPGPAVWLLLLSLYQTTGRKAQYDALARGFSTLFNAAVPPWANSRDTGARDLESYSQVMMRLQTAWPKPEIRPFLEALLNDDRGGSRQGFTLAAYREILFLIDVYGVIERMEKEDDERTLIQAKLGRH